MPLRENYWTKMQKQRSSSFTLLQFMQKRLAAGIMRQDCTYPQPCRMRGKQNIAIPNRACLPSDDASVMSFSQTTYITGPSCSELNTTDCECLQFETTAHDVQRRSCVGREQREAFPLDTENWILSYKSHAQRYRTCVKGMSMSSF